MSQNEYFRIFGTYTVQTYCIKNINIQFCPLLFKISIKLSLNKYIIVITSTNIDYFYEICEHKVIQLNYLTFDDSDIYVIFFKKLKIWKKI